MIYLFILHVTLNLHQNINVDYVRMFSNQTVLVISGFARNNFFSTKKTVFVNLKSVCFLPIMENIMFMLKSASFNLKVITMTNGHKNAVLGSIKHKFYCFRNSLFPLKMIKCCCQAFTVWLGISFFIKHIISQGFAT
jgi:hypothetical protein